MPPIADLLLAFVALYPVMTAALWVAGGLLFRLTDEQEIYEPASGWPAVTVLIPAYNEEAVIATSVTAALASRYPDFEVIVLDDGSVDRTQQVALAAAARAPGGERCRVLRDATNRGKAEQLNRGFAEARHEVVVVTDADAHVHPLALRFLAARLEASPQCAAVAGAPHVTNRTRLICTMQVLEAAAIIGLIRRTQSLTGRVGTVAGVLGIFRRDRVLAVGGYDGKMATEDIDLTWRLLMAGWHTAYEPRALVGMEVPTTPRALWAQRTRWARGQGEVLRTHALEVLRWRNHRMWLLSLESMASLAWVCLLVVSLVIAAVQAWLVGDAVRVPGSSLAWGIAIAVIASVQLFVAVALNYRYGRWDVRTLIVGSIYLLFFWTLSASAALHSQVIALIRGPRERRVVWDLPREEAAVPTEKL